jgi:RNA-directed DNA polymerase
VNRSFFLETNLHDLHARVQRGAYRARPSRRQYIPKPDGRQRPLTVAALEDKIVQRATATLLNAIYEEDFLGFSYGFRPGRSAHHAMDALVVGIGSRKVNWVLDDAKRFLDLLRERMGKFALALHPEKTASTASGCRFLVVDKTVRSSFL